MQHQGLISQQRSDYVEVDAEDCIYEHVQLQAMERMVRRDTSWVRNATKGPSSSPTTPAKALNHYAIPPLAQSANDGT